MFLLTKDDDEKTPEVPEVQTPEADSQAKLESEEERQENLRINMANRKKPQYYEDGNSCLTYYNFMFTRFIDVFQTCHKFCSFYTYFEFFLTLKKIVIYELIFNNLSFSTKFFSDFFDNYLFV